MTKILPGKSIIRETASFDRGLPFVLVAGASTVLVRPKNASDGEYGPVTYEQIAALCRLSASRSIQLDGPRRKRKAASK